MDHPTTAPAIADLPAAAAGLSSSAMYTLFRARPETWDMAEEYRIVVELASAVSAQGGRLFLVGGAVRDEVLGAVPRDFDLEVHGLTPAELESLLPQFGPVSFSGRSFGTYKLHTPQGLVEIALPRRDSQIGLRHTDVAVDIVPNLGVTAAARRREFTIGAIYKDVLTGQLYDPFGGITDLRQRVLKMVDAATFADDPLRLLRGVRQLARYALTLDPATEEAMRRMVERFGVLPKDRLREEWWRLLTEAPLPSVGVMLLRRLGVLERWHPEVSILWTTPQDPHTHPEGDVGRHTMMVIDAAAELARHDRLDGRPHIELMLAALAHDLGKPATTQTAVKTDGQPTVTAINHEVAGLKPAENFLQAIGTPAVMVQRILKLTEYHRRPALLYRDRQLVSDEALRRLAHDIGSHLLRLLIILSEADHRGRGPFPMPSGQTHTPDTTNYRAWWEEQITRLELDQLLTPILWGRDLVDGRGERNWLPGPAVGEAVTLAQELALGGMTREEVLQIINQADTPEQALTALRAAVQRRSAQSSTSAATDGAETPLTAGGD